MMSLIITHAVFKINEQTYSVFKYPAHYAQANTLGLTETLHWKLMHDNELAIHLL